MIKAIVFDLDDTLYPEMQYNISGLEYVSGFIANKYNIDSKVVQANLKEIYMEDRNFIYDRFFNRLNIEYTEQDIQDILMIYREHKPNISLYEDARQVIEFIREKKLLLGIISDGYLASQRKKIEALNLKDLFNHIVLSDELGGKDYWKPHEKPYITCRTNLSVEFNEMMYVGDNISKDFITANKLGIITVCINRDNGIYSKNTHDAKEEYLARYNIRTLKEIETLIT